MNWKYPLFTVLLCAAILFSGCGGAAAEETEITQTAPVTESAPAPEESGPPTLPGLTYERTMEKRYARQFDVYYYEGGYKYLAIGDGNSYLVVPERRRRRR